MINTQKNDDQSTDEPQDVGGVVAPIVQYVATQDDQATQGAVAVPGVPDVAEDADLIEKEWVHKAKEIVENTKNNPHAQSEQIQHMRADYIKKRYNRDIQNE